MGGGTSSDRWHRAGLGGSTTSPPSSAPSPALPASSQPFLHGAADRGRAEHRDLLQPLLWWPGGRGQTTAPPFPSHCGDTTPIFVLGGCCACTHPAAHNLQRGKGSSRLRPQERAQQDHHARGSPPPHSIWGSGTDGQHGAGAVCLSLQPQPQPHRLQTLPDGAGHAPRWQRRSHAAGGSQQQARGPEPCSYPKPFLHPTAAADTPFLHPQPHGCVPQFPPAERRTPRVCPLPPPSPSSAPPAGGGCLGQAKWVNGRGSATQIPLRRPSWGCVMVRASPWQCPHSPPVSPVQPPAGTAMGRGGPAPASAPSPCPNRAWSLQGSPTAPRQATELLIGSN